MSARAAVCALFLVAACRAPVQSAPTTSALAGEVAALHRDMVAAFRENPASVARYYTDDATIMGGGRRSLGRDEVDAYWRASPSGASWALDVLEVGGDAKSPWVRGRSTLSSASGMRMVTDYVGILKRGADGALRFYVDIYVASPINSTPRGGAAEASAPRR